MFAIAIRLCTGVNRTKTGTKTDWPLRTQANLRSRNQTGLIGLRFGTFVNVKIFWVSLRPVPGGTVHEMY